MRLPMPARSIHIPECSFMAQYEMEAHRDRNPKQKRVDMGGNRRHHPGAGFPRRSGPAKRKSLRAPGPGVSGHESISRRESSSSTLRAAWVFTTSPLNLPQCRVGYVDGDSSRFLHWTDLSSEPAFCRIHPMPWPSTRGSAASCFVPAPSAASRVICCALSDACEPACRLARPALRCNSQPFTPRYGDSRVFR